MELMFIFLTESINILLCKCRQALLPVSTSTTCCQRPDPNKKKGPLTRTPTASLPCLVHIHILRLVHCHGRVLRGLRKRRAPHLRGLRKRGAPHISCLWRGRSWLDICASLYRLLAPKWLRIFVAFVNMCTQTSESKRFFKNFFVDYV